MFLSKNLKEIFFLPQPILHVWDCIWKSNEFAKKLDERNPTNSCWKAVSEESLK